MSNSMIQKPKFSVAIRSDAYKRLINNTLGDPERAKRFIASVSSAVGANATLQECDSGSVVTAALLGESLNLSPSPQLGQYYMVPFECKIKGPDGKNIYKVGPDGKKLKDSNGHWIAESEKRAQFVLGYKGYIQLALRSGCYKDLDVQEIREGEYLGKDPMTGKPRFQFVEDDEQRDKLEVVGYMAYFEYLNGFRKVIYWSRKKMESHADQYSAAFSMTTYEKIRNHEIPEKDMWKYSSFWYKNFDEMAKKTMLRQLISRWGIMSTEMQKAFEADNNLVEQNEDGEFVTAPADESPALPQETKPNPPTEPEAEGIGEPMSLDDFEEE